MQNLDIKPYLQFVKLIGLFIWNEQFYFFSMLLDKHEVHHIFIDLQYSAFNLIHMFDIYPC